MYFFSSRRRHTRWPRDWSSDVCSSDLEVVVPLIQVVQVSPSPLELVEHVGRLGFRCCDRILLFLLPRGGRSRARLGGTCSGCFRGRGCYVVGPLTPGGGAGSGAPHGFLWRVLAALAGLGVDAPLVADHRLTLELGFAHLLSSSSSTISASTMSSSSLPAGSSPPAAPASPAGLAPACSWLYRASPIFWLAADNSFCAVLTASMSSPSRAFFSASTFSVTSLDTSSGSFSSLSFRRRSVE